MLARAALRRVGPHSAQQHPELQQAQVRSAQHLLFLQSHVQAVVFMTTPG